MKFALVLTIILWLSSCSIAKPVSLKILFIKNGYTYASSGYRTYRAMLDTILKRGDLIAVNPCGCDTCRQVFKRIN